MFFFFFNVLKQDNCLINKKLYTMRCSGWGLIDMKPCSGVEFKLLLADPGPGDYDGNLSCGSDVTCEKSEPEGKRVLC